MTLRRLLPVLLALLWLLPTAAAHAGGGPAVRYEMPPWVTWFTGAGVVALSFAIVGAFLTRPHAAARAPAAGVPLERARPVATALRVVVLAVLVAVVALGLAGRTTVPVAVVWLVGWGLLPVLSYLVVDAWRVVSPFGLVAHTRRAYPAWLGTWPAVVAALAVAYAEVSPWATDGRLVALALGAHVLFHGAMAAVFGRPWLERAELVTATLRWWGAVAPLGVEDGRLRWRWPGAGLLRERVRDVSDVAFVVALLYAVSFDAFLTTPIGAAVTSALAALGQEGARVVVLVLGYLLFLGVLAASMVAVRRAAEAFTPTWPLAAAFAPALVPIAAAYHLAHNAPNVVLNLPMLWGAGAWSLPAAWAPWVAAAQVLAIVAGHVVAVVVAHACAFRGFPSRLQAVRSEVPFTAVMVFYTVVGLWLVSQGHTDLVGGA